MAANRTATPQLARQFSSGNGAQGMVDTVGMHRSFETTLQRSGTVSYQFNAYKLTCRYALRDRGAWRWGVGLTGLIRDADVALRQGARVADNDNVGFVPGLHLSGAYRFNERWQLRLDFNELAGGPGRLIDVAIKLDATLSPQWSVGAGYRTLEIHAKRS